VCCSAEIQTMRCGFVSILTMLACLLRMNVVVAE
jgi:hypothetical protein